MPISFSFSFRPRSCLYSFHCRIGRCSLNPPWNFEVLMRTYIIRTMVWWPTSYLTRSQSLVGIEPWSSALEVKLNVLAITPLGQFHSFESDNGGLHWRGLWHCSVGVGWYCPLSCFTAETMLHPLPWSCNFYQNVCSSYQVIILCRQVMGSCAGRVLCVELC